MLFIVFSIMFAYACMNESKNLIGLGAVGACIMFLVQVCQLVAAIKVRRWWCFAGTVIGIAVSLIVNKLPRKGNTIECKCYTTSGRKVIIHLK